MRIRRSTHARDLRSAPIDKLDAFLLTLLVDEMALTELTEIAPCDEAETTQRIHTLAALGLVEMLVSPAQQRFCAPRYRPDLNVRDDAVTLRPPPSSPRAQRRDSEGAVTLRPPLGAPLELDLDDFGALPQTGVRPRPVAPAQALAKLKILQRKA